MGTYADLAPKPQIEYCLNLWVPTIMESKRSFWLRKLICLERILGIKVKKVCFAKRDKLAARERIG